MFFLSLYIFKPFAKEGIGGVEVDSVVDAAELEICEDVSIEVSEDVSTEVSEAA